MSIEKIFTPQDDAFYSVITHAAGPQGALPLTPQMLMESPSGNLFGMTQNAGMGWDANKLTGKEVLIIGTQGGIRAGDGRPVALGYHTGHWEIGLQMQAAAKEITRNGGIPFAAFVSDPCDGRSQGTPGMFDSLPYRNDAAIVFRRLIRSLPTRRHHDCVGVYAPPADHSGAGRGHAAADFWRGCGQGADHRCTLRQPRAFFAGGRRAGLSRLRVAGRRLSVPGHGRDVTGGGRSLRAGAAAFRTGPVRAGRVAGDFPPVRAGGGGAG